MSNVKNIQTSNNRVKFLTNQGTIEVAHQIGEYFPPYLAHFGEKLSKQSVHRIIILSSNGSSEIENFPQGKWFEWKTPCFAEFFGVKLYAFTSYYDGSFTIETPLDWDSEKTHFNLQNAFSLKIE